MATGHETRFTGFLEDAEDPFGGEADRVAAELRAIDTDKGGGTWAAFDDIVPHDEAGGLELGTLWAEVGQASGATEVDRTLARICEVTFFDDDIACAAFELDGGTGGEAFFAGETAAGDQTMMTADEVDPLAAPAGDGAITDRELVEAGTLDAIMIALGANVADLDLLDRDAGGGIRQIAAVVEIEAVTGLAADAQFSQREVLAAGEVKGVATAFEVRWLRWIKRLNGELFDAADGVAAGVVARGEFECGAGFQDAQSSHEFVRRLDEDLSSKDGRAKKDGSDERAERHGLARPTGSWARRSSSVTSWKNHGLESFTLKIMVLAA